MRRSGLVLAAAVLVGCGSGGVAEVGAVGEPEYACGTLTFTEEALAAAPTADDLDPDGQAAVDGHLSEPIDPGWRVLAASDSEVELIRELSQPEPSEPGAARTHEVLRMHTASGLIDFPDGSWVLDAQGSCVPRLELGALSPTDLVLAGPPSPDARQVELEVYERGCASGQSADDRVELVEQETSDEQVMLVIGVRRQGDGEQTCPANPPTRLTIELDEPLCDRVIVDGSTLPPQPVEPSPTSSG